MPISTIKPSLSCSSNTFNVVTGGEEAAVLLLHVFFTLHVCLLQRPSEGNEIRKMSALSSVIDSLQEVLCY